LQQILGVFQEEIRTTVREEIQRETSQIKKQLTFIVKDYSSAILQLRKRVERIEDHLDLPEN
jgi:hypothetical protein